MITMHEHYIIRKYRITNRVFVIIIATVAFITFFILSGTSYGKPIFIYRNNDNNNSKSNSSVGSTSIALCVLVRTHIGHESYLPVTALSLFGTGFDKIRLYAVKVDNVVDNQWLLNAINMINTIVGRADYITLLETGPIENNALQFDAIDRALIYLYKQYEHSPSTCEYVMLTNSDNLYSRHFGKHVIPHMRAKVDLIGWDYITKWGFGYTPEVTDNSTQIAAKMVHAGSNTCVSMILEPRVVDFGGVVYRPALLKEHNHQHHRIGRGEPESDGHFVKRAADFSSSLVIVRQTLFMHQ